MGGSPGTWNKSVPHNFQNSKFQNDLRTNILYKSYARMVPGKYEKGFMSKSSMEKKLGEFNYKKSEILF